MKIIKGGSGGKELVCTAEELKAVNAFAKAELSAEDVYIFSVLLCDNEIDRDHERFSEATLRELGELFVGVTGAATIRSHAFTARSLSRIKTARTHSAQPMFTSRAMRTCCAPRQTPSLSLR